MKEFDNEYSRIIKKGTLDEIIQLIKNDEGNLNYYYYQSLFLSRPDIVRELYFRKLISNDIIISTFFDRNRQRLKKSYIPEMFEDEEMIQYIINNLNELAVKSTIPLAYLSTSVFEREDFQNAFKGLSPSHRKVVLEKIKPKAKQKKPTLPGTVNERKMAAETVEEVLSAITSENRLKSFLYLLDYRYRMFLKLCELGEISALDIQGLIPYINSAEAEKIPSKYFQDKVILDYILNHLEYVEAEKSFIFKYLPLAFFQEEKVVIFIINNFQNLIQYNSSLLKLAPTTVYQDSRFISLFENPEFLNIFLQNITITLMMKMPSELFVHQKLQDYLIENIEYVLSAKIFLLKFFSKSLFENEKLFEKEENAQLFIENMTSQSIDAFPKDIFLNKQFFSFFINNLDDVLQNKMFLLKYLPQQCLDDEKFNNQLFDSIKNGKCRVEDLPQEILSNPLLFKQLLTIIPPKRYFIFPSSLFQNSDFVMQSLNYISADCYDFLPIKLMNNALVKEKCGITENRDMATSIATSYDKEQDINQTIKVDKESYDENWVDEQGNLISFFTLIGDFPIKSKSDYYKIYKEYIESDLSVPRFCRIYGISSVEGFNKLLNKIQAESSLDDKKIRDHKLESSERFLGSISSLFNQLMVGEISFEEFLDSNLLFNDVHINFLYNYCAKSETERNFLSKIVIEYVQRSKPVFKESFVRLLTVGKASISETFDNYVLKNARINAKSFFELENSIKGIAKTYRRKSLYMNIMIGSEVIPIDDNVIDKTLLYLKENHYHINFDAMCIYCKKMALGEINCQSQLEDAKAELRNSIIALVYDEKTLMEYIEKMREFNKKHE